MDLGLKGRVALVTGAARGIGLAVARGLAREGCDLALVDRDPDGLADAASDLAREGGRVLPLPGDVRDLDAVGRIVEQTEAQLGRLDIVVCNAGITRDAVVWKMDESAWDEVLDVNLKGCFALARAAAPRFRSRSWGRLVAVSSINGLRGKFGQANYAASKAGLVGLCKTLAKELGRFGVTVNVVAPGMVETEMARALPQEVLEGARQETVVGRLAEPTDVADAIVFLCSERARHITGAVLKVDGGQYI